MLTDFDVDASIEDAWRAFRIDLADRLSRLGRGDVITVAQSTDEFPGGPHGKLTFTLTGSRRVRCSLAVSDLHPTEEYRLENIDELLSMGWRPLRGNTFIVEAGRRGIDILAIIAAQILRDVWEVIHPTFLVNDDPAPAAEPAIMVGVAPISPTHLRELSIAAMGRIMHREIDIDDDGDIPFPGPIASWIRMCCGEPHLEFVACVLSDVPDMFEAAHYIATRAPRWPSISLRLMDTQIFAVLRLEASVFHEHNLLSAMSTWAAFLTDDVPQIREDLVEPRLAFKPEPVDETENADALPEALMTLLYLDDDGPLDAGEVAQVCGFDRGAILEYLRICSQENINWRKSADDTDDPEEAAACLHEADAWEATMKSLRDALRVVVLPDAGRRSGSPRDRRPSNT